MPEVATQCSEEKSNEGSEHFDEHATHCEIERLLRAYFENYYKPHRAKHDRAFAPGTVTMAEAIMPLLDHLDEGRRAPT